MKLDRTVFEVVDLDAEEVLHGPLVDDVPLGGQRVDERIVGF